MTPGQDRPTPVTTPVGDSATALYQAMIGGAGPAATGWAGGPDYAPPPRPGERILILGGGIAGLTAAYELSLYGFDCIVLEAQNRVGGRNRTARKGDKLYELDERTGKKVHTHTCRFDDGMYLNLGPGRIPYHHRRVLKYCRDFKVALEPYVMETTANLVRPPGVAAAWPNRRVANDTRGHLAAKLAEGAATTDPHGAELLDLLRVFGALDVDGKYRGSTRSGYLSKPEINDFPVPAPPIPFDDLLKSGFWKARFYQPVDYLWQATMFQPVGGMDKIVDALAREARLAGAQIVLEAVVTRIDIDEDGDRVSVTYVKDGKETEEKARYCVSNIPVPVLRPIRRTGFSRAFEHALEVVKFEKTCKVGWQANRRFWEGNLDSSIETEGIYGGISWTSHNITQLWYPSNDYFSAKGTLTGAYNFKEQADELGALSPDRRLKLARQGAAELHPEFNDTELVPDAKAVTIAWHKVPFQLGGFADWEPGKESHKQAYKQLLQPEGREAFYVTGDQISPLPGWQEGAMMSAQYVVQQILGIMPVSVPEVIEVPDTAALTQGLY
ncbi:FAD-dependent oxidoreductase [Kitasatospora sp. MAP5-34]|uniref:flavin monoamine oxidase family protein n=1 Tax=Kitasatospora sp. MAP5-34 TaxID=3035102 RepID=UPI0024753093|nr:FAD-dependent oxidoreductase [Kitasatospora sp. MAP5-34]MDH6576009.1 monoamine oxidase [Kitasatospora sp. MAP5-34]